MVRDGRDAHVRRRRAVRPPFASPNALFNLSKLSIWWLRLGTEIERIKPGNPQQNGRHARMHLTLKLETTRPAGENFLQQQAKFDGFIDCYVEDHLWRASFMTYDLGHFDDETCRLEPIANPFGPKTLPMSPA